MATMSVEGTGTAAATPATRRDLPAVVLVTALIYLVIVALTVRHYGGNITALVGAGTMNGITDVIPGTLGHHVVVYRAFVYDGMAYYYVAADPFLQHPIIHAPMRYQRIGYPLLVWAFSFGQRDWRPAAMLGVNLAAVLAVTVLAVLLLQRYAPGASPWWGLICALNPMLIIGVQNDLAEPLMLALSLGGLLLYLQRRIALAALAFAAALLTREVAVLLLLPLLVAELVGRRPRTTLLLTLALLPYVVWELALLHAFGHAAASADGTNIGLPFKGILDVVIYARHSGGQRLGWLILLGLVFFDVVALIVSLRQMRQSRDVVVGGILVHSAVALCGALAIWSGFLGAARVFGGIYPLTILGYTRYRTLSMGLLAAGTIAFIAITLVRSVLLAPVFPYYVTP